MTKSGIDIEKLIHQDYKLKDLILDGKFTKTTHFLVPGLHLNVDMRLFNKYFANAFLDDEEITHILKNPIFLLFRTKLFDEAWEFFETSLKKSPRFVYEYVVGKNDDDYLIMFLFEFPSAYRADYHKFKEGEYSKFSDQFKKLFKESTKNDYGKTVENPLYGVVHKTSTFKKKLEFVVGETIEPFSELWEKWSPEREIFRKKEVL